MNDSADRYSMAHRLLLRLLGLLFCGLWAAAGEPEILDLKDGHQVTGEVLADKAHAHWSWIWASTW